MPIAHSPRALRTVLRAAAVGTLVLLFGSGAAPSEGVDPYFRPGRLVPLADGRLLNLVCSGRGRPTVLLEAGYGAGAFAWSRVQPILARETRTCSYDRAGYGFSDAGPSPRDGAAIVRDLDAGLRKAGETGPFVVVGHSAGGLYARLFAARRHSDTVGLVLVDTSVTYQDRRFAALFGPGAASLEGLRRQPRACLDAAERGSVTALGAAGCLPKDEGHARVVASKPASWRTRLSELDTLFSTTGDEVTRTLPILKDVPTIVLTASPNGIAAGPEDPGAVAWQMFHREIAAGALHGEQRIIKSSHLMMNDRPEVVAAAALELVKSGRKTPYARR